MKTRVIQDDSEPATDAVNRQAPVVGMCETEIAAAPDVVWEVLTAIEHWSSWNPDVKSMEFEGPLGARLDVPLEVLIASRGFIPSLLKGYSRKSCSVA